MVWEAGMTSPLRIYEGATEVQKIVIARQLLAEAEGHTDGRLCR